MPGGEGGGEEATRVGDEVVDTDGRLAGSRSLSGIGGERQGRRVVRRRIRRRIALQSHIP